jgi:transposase InsO family protein
MPWKSVGVMDQRIAFVVRGLNPERNLASLCRDFGISRPTGYRWLKRFQEKRSFSGLQEKSRRPQHSPKRTLTEDEARVVELRKKYGWGARKLAALLYGEGKRLKVTTIHRIISRNGLILPENRHGPATSRFEREKPNALWQADFKGYFLGKDGNCHPLSILDDHSRYAVCLSGLRSQKMEETRQAFLKTFEAYGLPDEILMDHGTTWWSTNNGYGLTSLSVWLLKQEIDLIFGRIRHPQTQGKVERFNRTVADAVEHRGKPSQFSGWSALLEDIRSEYNEIRPHEALEMAVPASRYHPSTRAYNPNPLKWEYESGSTVARLNAEGFVGYKGRWYFVCEALADEQVRLEEVASVVLVSYRNMYIREIDPVAHRTKPLVQSRADLDM